MKTPPTGEVTLRDVTEADLPVFFAHQQDPEANAMAGFLAREWNDFLAHWHKILADRSDITQTILFNGRVAGNVGSFVQDGEREVGYWLGQEYWGRGIATRALALFLNQVVERPLFARVVKHNQGSQRVLQKCGFTRIGEDGEELIFKRNT